MPSPLDPPHFIRYNQNKCAGRGLTPSGFPCLIFCTQLLPEYLMTNAGKIEDQAGPSQPKTGKWDHAVRHATDTTVRPMRPVSDTKKRVLATTMVSLQLRERTTSQPALPAPWDTAVQPPHSPHPSSAEDPMTKKMRHRAASRTRYNSAARAAHFTYRNLDFS